MFGFRRRREIWDLKEGVDEGGEVEEKKEFGFRRRKNRRTFGFRRRRLFGFIRRRSRRRRGNRRWRRRVWI